MCNDCARLHEQLHEQAAMMFGLRKRITRLQGELRYERQEKSKLLKEKRQKDHYRNGQKRSNHGRN